MSLATMKSRIEYMGGDNIGRIKQQKLNSFKAALKNDYNSRPILTPLGEEFRCLINDDNTKSDYDKRYGSVSFDAQLQPGDVFECTDDHTHWMIYLQDLVEVAYLKAEIIRCRYQLTVNNTDYWIYFQGPTETEIRWNLKNDINWNELNLSGTVYIKKDDNTKDYFNRFTKLKIDGHTWNVDVVDTITVPGIIELELSEYFDSITQDLVEVYKADDIVDDSIIGRLSVEPGSVVGYQVNSSLFNSDDSWSVSGNDNVSIQGYQADGQTCLVAINPEATGNFVLAYGSKRVEIIIDQPFEMISGETKVYPYGSYIYTAANSLGTFSIEGKGAEITHQEKGKCNIEITTGRKGSFILRYTVADVEYSLLIKILSL